MNHLLKSYEGSIETKEKQSFLHAILYLIHVQIFSKLSLATCNQAEAEL